MADPTTTTKSSPILIAVAWAIVVLPTAWGFRYTLQSALKIFTPATAPASPVPPAKP
jgi:hypothetical protein